MRTGKELILATKPFTVEDRARSWFETILTLSLIVVVLLLLLLPQIPLVAKPFLSVICGLLYVRMFVIYHDYQHHAILQKSKIAEFVMTVYGVFILAPQNIWKRSHDHHHNNNSKLTLTGIGSYPTICKKRFLGLSAKDRNIYLLNRHPLTIFLGYFTLFFYWLNVKSFLQSPQKHLDSLVAVVFHVLVGGLIGYFLGATTLWVSWFVPFFLAFAIGSYLFYSQHNFPEAQFKENQDWTYAEAALDSTSFMVMNPVLNWFTGNIGYHHVHHLNSRIPFYRLKETMYAMPELQHVKTTTFWPTDIYKCLRLKVWDAEQHRMLTLKEVYA
ncbi:MAG: fatty acid desaturase [Cytophagales bacterium]